MRSGVQVAGFNTYLYIALIQKLLYNRRSILKKGGYHNGKRHCNVFKRCSYNY